MEKRVSIAVESEDKVAGVVAKSGAMYLGIIALWLLSLAWFMPQLVAFWSDVSALNRALLVFVLFCLALFWFYGIYFWAFFLMGQLSRRGLATGITGTDGEQGDLPQVAILYTAADDFEYQAALSCVEQRYHNFHVFLLDDSARQESRAQIDAFHAAFPALTTVIRRNSREGFKAGNLNNALAVMSDDYPLFAISDADGVLPPNFLSQVTPYFLNDPQLGFAQANHRDNGLDTGSFAHDLVTIADVRWDHHFPRDRYGLSSCWGHGVMLRTEAWRRAGGFPYIVAEDLAITMAMRAQGYHGMFMPQVVCGEGVPSSLAAWRKQKSRSVSADLECFFKAVVPFFRARRATLVEKVDVAVHTLRMPVNGLFLPFLIAVSFLLDSLHGEAVVLESLSWEFLLFILLIGLGGYLGMLSRIGRRPATGLKFTSQITALQLSLIFLHSLALLTYGVTGRSHFFVTGSGQGTDRPIHTRSFLSAIAAIDPNRSAVRGVEAALVVLLAYVAFVTQSWVVLAVSAALLIMLLRLRLSWGWLPGRILVHAPVLLIMLGVFSGLTGILGTPGQFLTLAALSVLVYP